MNETQAKLSSPRSAMSEFFINTREAGVFSIVNLTSVIYIIVLGITFKDFYATMQAWVVVAQAIGVTVILCNLYFHHKTKNVPVAAGVLLFCMFAIHMANVTFAGGIDTVHYAWIFIFPILAGGTMGWKGQVFFWFMCMLGTVYYYLWPAELEVVPYADELHYTVITRLLCITIFSLIMLVYYFTLSEKMQHLQKALKLANFEGDLFAGVFNSQAQSVILVDEHGFIQRANKMAHLTFGYEKLQLNGQNVSSICQHGDSVFAKTTTGFTNKELQIKTHNKREIWIVYSSLKVVDENEVPHTLYTIEDITERKRFESELSHLAHFDHLTQIPNRLMIQEKLTEMIQAYPNDSFAVVFIDLDKFKDINDMRGHEAGDAVLLEVANRLQTNIREGDFIGRFGGDEFILLTQINTTQSEIVDLVKQLQNILTFTIFYEQTENHIGSSVGIAQYPTDGIEANDLIRKADAAMYRTKLNDKGNFTFYSSEDDEGLQRKLLLNAALNSAIENNEFSLAFQPIFDENKSLLGAEALIRWHHPEFGWVGPDEFIPLSEDNGQIIEIGTWVLDQACRVMRVWQEAGQHHLTMSVNISYKQIVGTSLAKLVKQSIEKHHVNGHNLILELTERVIAEDLALVKENLALFKKMGVSAAVDDFGIAYSSLSYLQKVDFDILKIDRSFVLDIDKQEDALLLCQAILSMAHSLQLSVTAEGIESETHFHMLKKMNVNKYQGYYLSKPLSEDDFLALF